MSFLAFFGTRLGLEVLGLIALAALVAGVYHHVWHNGYEDGIAEYAPVMASCADSLASHSVKECASAIKQSASDLATEKQNNAALEAVVGRQNAALSTLADAATKAKAAAAAASKQADEDAVFYAERLKSLRSNIDHPAKEPNADADRILRALAVDRRMQH